MRLLIQSWGWAVLMLILSLPLILPGQVKQLNNFYGSDPVNGDICVKAGNFETDASAERLVTQIMEKYGAQNRFLILPCDRTSTAQATLDDNKRPVILYNPQFLESIQSLSFTTATIPVSPTNWEKLAVIAHEVAHHLNYHLTSPHPEATLRSMELEADVTAGFILYKFGASLQEAQRVMYSSAVSVEGSMTHPPRAQRLDAIERGWQLAKTQAMPSPVPSAPEPTIPVTPAPPAPEPVTSAWKQPCLQSNLPGVLGLTGTTGIAGTIFLVGINIGPRWNHWYNNVYLPDPITHKDDYERYTNRDDRAKLYYAAGAVVFATGAAVFLNKIIKVSNHNRGCPGAMSARHAAPTRLHVKPVLSTQGNAPGIGISLGFEAH